jgi:hypothetical protein
VCCDAEAIGDVDAGDEKLMERSSILMVAVGDESTVGGGVSWLREAMAGVVRAWANSDDDV